MLRSIVYFRFVSKNKKAQQDRTIPQKLLGFLPKQLQFNTLNAPNTKNLLDMFQSLIWKNQCLLRQIEK